jgi:hypothetical protein
MPSASGPVTLYSSGVGIPFTHVASVARKYRRARAPLERARVTILRRQYPPAANSRFVKGCLAWFAAKLAQSTPTGMQCALAKTAGQHITCVRGIPTLS